MTKVTELQFNFIIFVQKTQGGSEKNDKKGVVASDAFSNIGDDDLWFV